MATFTVNFTPVAAKYGITTSSENLPNATIDGTVTPAGTSTTLSDVLITGSRAARIATASGFTVPRIEGAGWDVSPSINGTNGIFVLPILILFGKATINTLAGGGVRLRLYSGGGAANYRTWIVDGSDSIDFRHPVDATNRWWPIVIDPVQPGDYADGGTFDVTAISRIEIHISRISADNYNLQIDECFYLDSWSVYGTNVSLQDVFDYFDLAGTLKSLLFRQSDGQYFSYFPLNFGNGSNQITFADSNFYLRFAAQSGNNKKVHVGATKMGLFLNGGAGTSEIVLENALITRTDGLTWISSVSPGDAATISRILLQAEGTTILDAGYMQNGGAFISRGEISLAGGLNNVAIVDSAASAALVLDGGAFINCSFSGNTSGLKITAAGDYSANTATFVDNGTYDVYIDATVTDGQSIDISGFEFLGSTPTNIYWAGTTGEITLTVSQAGLSTDSAGGTITLAEPQVALIASNFADNIRIYTARYQTFVINSADINTTTEEITLGTDNETDAAFAGQITTPATLAYLVAAPGATLPTTTPQINTANLYYVVANSSGVIQLSETEGGTAIAFSDTGTESGGYLFSLTCTTQLSNEIISGGNGFSASYALPDGALIEVAAQGIAADESTATTLFYRIVEWSSTAGASIADTFSLVNNPDRIYNQLIGATITSRRATSVTITTEPSSVTGISFDLSGNIEIDANAIVNASLSAPDAYLWSVYQRYTEAGIRYIRNQFQAIGIMEFDFNGILTLDNVADGIRNSPATVLRVIGNIYTSAGKSIYAPGTGLIEPEPFFVADLTSAGDGSFTSSDRNQLDELYATLESSGVFSTDALANAPSGGGGGSSDATAANQTTIINHLTDIKGPTWTTTDSLEAIRDRGDIAWITATGFSTLVQADIRTALGVASANIDTQLGNIPTTAAFEARTLPSADYFDPSADEVTVGSNNDKSGYSLTQPFPANFANLGISTEGYINRVVTNSDMRGTDGALLADSYTAPDNAAIADIKTKTDQLTFTVANQVDSNALTGGGGDDAETIFAYFSGQGYTTTRAGYLDKLNLPGALTQTSDLPTNFTDLAIAETTGLVSIGSLPTIPANWLTAAGIAADAISKIQSGLSTLTESSVRSAVGLLTANLDTQLAAIGSDINAVLVDTGTSIPNLLATLQTSVNDLPDEVAAQSAIAQLILQVDRVHLIHGLEIGTPLVVSETSRTAGDLAQTISTVDDISTVTRTA